MDGYVYCTAPTIPIRPAAAQSMCGRNMATYMEVGVSGPHFPGCWLGGASSQFAHLKVPPYSVWPKGIPAQFLFPTKPQFIAESFRQNDLPNGRPSSAPVIHAYGPPAPAAGVHPVQRQYGYLVERAFANTKPGQYYMPPRPSYYLPAEESYGHPTTAAASNRWLPWTMGNPQNGSYDSSTTGPRHIMPLMPCCIRGTRPSAVMPPKETSTVSSAQPISKTRISDGESTVNHQLTQGTEGNSANLPKPEVAEDKTTLPSSSPVPSRRRSRARQRPSPRATHCAQRSGCPQREVAQGELQPVKTQPEQQPDSTRSVFEKLSDLASQRTNTLPEKDDELQTETLVVSKKDASRSDNGLLERESGKPLDESSETHLSESASTETEKLQNDSQNEPENPETPEIIKEEKQVKTTEYLIEPPNNEIVEEPQSSRQLSGISIQVNDIKAAAPVQFIPEGQIRKGPKDSRIVRGPRLQHKYIPWWVYFALDIFPQVFRSVVDFYFENMHWPRLEDQPVTFQEECVMQGISRDLHQISRGFAPAWVFVLKKLCDEGTVDKDVFPHLLGIFFENSEFPSMDTLPPVAKEMCSKMELAADNFYAVDI